MRKMQVIEVGCRFYMCEYAHIARLCTLVWIVGHVLAGWDGTAAQSNPTNLCKFRLISFAHILLTSVLSLPDVIIH